MKGGAVETLRDAVSNAFDALTEVEHAIPKYDSEVFREETVNHADNGMDKETAEKFVREIDELEDILLNRDVASSSLKRHEKREKASAKKKDLLLEKNKDETKSAHSKSEKVIDGMDLLVKKDKHYDLKNFFEENRDLLEEMETDSDDETKFDEKKSKDTSLNVLLDVLKKGMDEKNEEEKFEEYLLSNFAKETQKKKKDALKKETKKSTLESKESEKKDSEKKDEAIKTKANEKKSSSDAKDKTEVDNCGDKSEKKECDAEKNSIADKKNTASKKENADKKEKKETKTNEVKEVKSKEIENKRAAPKHVANHPKHKRPLWSKKEVTNENYDDEIKDLVDVILRRREDTKREKLKVALSDLFSILDVNKIHEE